MPSPSAALERGSSLMEDAKRASVAAPAALLGSVGSVFEGVSGMFPNFAGEAELQAEWEGSFRHVTPQLALAIFSSGAYDEFARHCEENLVSQAWDGCPSASMVWNISSTMHKVLRNGLRGSASVPLLDFSVPRTAADMPTAQMLFATCSSIHSWTQAGTNRIAVVLAHEDDRAHRLPLLLACLALFSRMVDSVPAALEVAAAQLSVSLEDVRLTLPPSFLRYTYYFDEVMATGRLPSSGRLQLDTIVK